MAEPPSESPTLGHDPADPAEAQAPSTPLDTVSVDHDADSGEELGQRQRLQGETAEEIQPTRGQTPNLQELMQELAEQIRRLEELRERRVRERAELIRERAEFENRDTSSSSDGSSSSSDGASSRSDSRVILVLWRSGRDEIHGCCVRVSSYELAPHNSQIPPHRPESHFPQVRISIYRPGGRWELDTVNLTRYGVAQNRGYLVSIFRPGIPSFFNS